MNGSDTRLVMHVNARRKAENAREAHGIVVLLLEMHVNAFECNMKRMTN